MKILNMIPRTVVLGKIDESLEVQTLDLPNGDLIEVSKINGSFIITNAMNGYGHNIKGEYELNQLYLTDHS